MHTGFESVLELGIMEVEEAGAPSFFDTAVSRVFSTRPSFVDTGGPSFFLGLFDAADTGAPIWG